MAGAHTGLFDTKKKAPEFLPKDLFLLLMRCDGAHEIDKTLLSEREKKFFGELRDARMIRPAEFRDFLKPEQEYKTYPAVYKQSAHWSITEACNLKCRHCFMSAPHAKHGAPTHEQIISIADQLAEYGVFQTGLTGDEPLVREDFLDIIDALNERAIGITTIYTNGWLVDEKLLDELDKLHCTRIVIAHRLSTVRNCDRILVMDQGAIIEEGTYDELIQKNGYFADLVARQRLDH